MIIRPTDTVRDILHRRATLFNMAREQIDAQIANIECPPFIPVVWWGVWVGGYRTRSVGFDLYGEAITMRELERLQHFEGGDVDAFINALSVMLRIEPRKVWRLQFLSAYRYFLEIMAELQKVAKAFDTLKLPSELRLPEDGNKYTEIPSRGIADLVLRFTRGTQYTEETAYKLRWIYVFRELQLQWEENCNQRKRIIDERTKQEQRNRIRK